MTYVTFQASKFIPSIEIHKVSFREQSLIGRYDNMKEMPQKNLIFSMNMSKIDVKFGFFDPKYQ